MIDAGRSVHVVRPRRDFDAAQFWHSDVQDEQVGVVFLAETQRLQPVARLSDHGQTGGLEQPSSATPDNAVVISQQHAHVVTPQYLRAVAPEPPPWFPHRLPVRWSSSPEAP
jgi:hypothetical protein